MKKPLDVNTKIYMIEEEILITKERIELLHGMKAVEVDEAVLRVDLDGPILYAEEEHFYSHQVVSLVNALIKNGLGDHLTP